MDPERTQVKGLFWASARTYARLAWRVFFASGPDRPRPGVRRMAVMLAFLPGYAALQCMHWLAFRLDDLLFPGYRAVRIEAPLFIVGVPRSGTTFLHRVLARDEGRFTTFSLWELVLAPAIVERKVIWALGRADHMVGRPFERMLRAVAGWCTGGLKAVHKLALEEPEEDFLLLMPVMACFILIVAFPHDPELSDLAYFDTRLPEGRRKRILAFYRTMIQRHLYAHGTDARFLSKNVSFTPLLGSLLKTFPDARFVLCLREPAAAVPSQISSMEAGWRLFGNAVNSADFPDRWVNLMAHYYTCLRDLPPELRKEAVCRVDMASLQSDLEREVRGIYSAFGIDIAAAFADRLAEEARKGRAYRSRHAYGLEKYGLDKATIDTRFAGLYAPPVNTTEDLPHVRTAS